MRHLFLLCALLAAVPASAQVAADSPFVRVVTPSGYVCEPGDGLNSTCYDLEVTCDAAIVNPATGQPLAMRTAIMKVSRPPAGATVGNILFTTGSGGMAFYSASLNPDPFFGARGTVRTMRDAGYLTFELRWSGADGFVTGVEGAGFSRVMCGAQNVLFWLQHFSGLTAAATPTCATGNSAGAMQIAAMLAIETTPFNKADYHAATQNGLHTVVYSGGPSFSRQDKVCFDTPYSLATGVGSGVNFDHPGRLLIDKLNGWRGNGDYCANYLDSSNAVVGSLPPATELAKMLGTQLVSLPLGADTSQVERRDFDTRTRQLTVVAGNTDGAGGPLYPLGADPSGSHFQAVYYNQLLTGVNAYAVLQQSLNQAVGAFPHTVDNTPIGAAKIQSLLLQHCR